MVFDSFMPIYRSPVWCRELKQPLFPFLTYLPVCGKMRNYIGKQYSWQQLYDPDLYSLEDVPKLKWVRAYLIPNLIGKVIQLHHQNELSAKMYGLIQETLSEIEWEPFEVSTLPFQKYFIVHFEIPAPPDNLTQQAMGLELFAELVTVNGISLNSEAGKSWMEAQNSLRIQADLMGEAWPELIGEFEIEVKAATYSNIRYPGIEVPLYL